jgi:NTE family protein
MIPAASNTSFAIVFTVFVVVSVVLVVLTLRFTLQRAAASRARWLGEQDDDEDDEPGPLTALVLAGGGTRGAVQVGMLQVLTEHGFVPDRIYGSSVGAVNGAAFAGDPTREGVERMTEIWRGLTRETVYPQGRLHGPWLYFQQRDSVFVNAGLRKVIEGGIGFERLEDAAIPIEVVATSLVDGRERWFTYGPAVDAVLASSAVPAIFPPVEIDGERFIDGGVVNNVPIRRAVEGGATRIVVLLCGPPNYTPASPRRPVEAMLNALLISIHARFARDLAQLPEGVEVIVCSGSEGEVSDFDDFSTTEALIAIGREEASEVVRRYGIGVPGPVDTTVTAGMTPTPESPADPGLESVGGTPDGALNADGDAPAGVASTHPDPGT